MGRGLVWVLVAIVASGCGSSATEGADEGGAVRAVGDAMQSAGAAATADQGPPEGLTWIAIRDINRVYDDDNSPTNRPPLTDEPPAGMIRPVDVSPDGQTDWLMDYTEAGSTQWCGTGGCRQRLFVSTPDGLQQIFDANADTIETIGNGQVRARVHHLFCDAETDEAGCIVSLTYDATSRRLVVSSGQDDFNPMGFGQSE